MEDQPVYSWNSKSILVVEDDESSAFLLGTFLKETGASITATREIKSFARDVVVIAQTAYAFSMDHQEAKRAGCDAYLTKPLNMCLLLDKMDGYLS